MLFFNNPYFKISHKKREDIDNQFGLIQNQAENLINSYSNPNDDLWKVLNGLPDYVTITLINDVNFLYMNADEQVKRQLLEMADKEDRLDAVDLFVIFKTMQQQSHFATELTLDLYKDLHDDKVRQEIATHLVSYCAWVSAPSLTYQVDENHSYTWGKYLGGGLMNRNYLEQRVVGLIKNPNLAYTTFNGTEMLYNHQLPYTGKEMAGARAKRDEAFKKYNQNVNNNMNNNNQQQPNTVQNNDNEDVL